MHKYQPQRADTSCVVSARGRFAGGEMVWTTVGCGRYWPSPRTKCLRAHACACPRRADAFRGAAGSWLRGVEWRLLTKLRWHNPRFPTAISGCALCLLVSLFVVLITYRGLAPVPSRVPRSLLMSLSARVSHEILHREHTQEVPLFFIKYVTAVG